jgi:hypothetical protein
METVLEICFGMSFIGGFVTVVATFVFRDRPEDPVKRTKRLASALNSIVAAGSGVAFLWLKLLTAVETLIGILLVFGLIEFAIRQWRPAIATRNK